MLSVGSRCRLGRETSVCVRFFGRTESGVKSFGDEWAQLLPYARICTTCVHRFSEILWSRWQDTGRGGVVSDVHSDVQRVLLQRGLSLELRLTTITGRTKSHWICHSPLPTTSTWPSKPLITTRSPSGL